MLYKKEKDGKKSHKALKKKPILYSKINNFYKHYQCTNSHYATTMTIQNHINEQYYTATVQLVYMNYVYFSRQFYIVI